MGIFDFFKKPQKLQDDTFGMLTYMEIKNNPSSNYFEGRRLFFPTSTEVEVFITADPEGPTMKQKEFYKRIESLYDELTEVKAKPVIEKEFQNWKADFKINDFKKEFKLVALSIPNLKAKELTWDMSFETTHDENHHITVNFKDYEVSDVLIDG